MLKKPYTLNMTDEEFSLLKIELKNIEEYYEQVSLIKAAERIGRSIEQSIIACKEIGIEPPVAFRINCRDIGELTNVEHQGARFYSGEVMPEPVRVLLHELVCGFLSIRNLKGTGSAPIDIFEMDSQRLMLLDYIDPLTLLKKVSPSLAIRYEQEKLSIGVEGDVNKPRSRF